MRRWYLLLIVLLAACGAPLPTPTPYIPTQTPHGAVVPTRVTPAFTRTPEVTLTSTPTLSPSPTRTLSPTPTVTPSHTFTPSPIPPLEEQNIRYGDTITGTIDHDYPTLRYQFIAQEGETITIALNNTSGSLDPLLILLDPQGQEINRNDDTRNGMRDSLLSEIPLPVEGVYTIIATRYAEAAGTTQGEFALTLELLLPVPSASPMPQSTLREVAYGNEYHGTITNENPEQQFTFTGARGDSVTIDLSAGSSDLDPLLILLDSSNRELARNDDRSPLTRDSRIAGFSLPAAGTYTIVATRYGGQQGATSGAFTLQLGLTQRE